MLAGVQGPAPQGGLAAAGGPCPSVGLALCGRGGSGSAAAHPLHRGSPCDIPLAYPGFYLTHRPTGFQFPLKETPSTAQTAGRAFSTKPAGGRPPTVGRVGGGSPRSPFPSWELSCAGRSRTPTGAEDGGQRPGPALGLPRHPGPSPAPRATSPPPENPASPAPFTPGAAQPWPETPRPGAPLPPRGPEG